jgi:hypothetical protein
MAGTQENLTGLEEAFCASQKIFAAAAEIPSDLQENSAGSQKISRDNE